MNEVVFLTAILSGVALLITSFVVARLNWRPDQPPYKQATLIDNLLVRDRLLALLSGFFGMVALLLVAIGSYGVLSYSVVQRTREIGIRVALGAQAFQVMRLVISEIAVTVALGVVVGLAGGFVLGHYVTSLLFEVKPGHAATVVFPLIGLMLVCLFAALPPTLRASRLNPVVALRQE